jgi:F-type H+-transporting ATPase subunit delta
MRISAQQYAQTLFDLTDGKSEFEIEKYVADFARYIHRNRKLKLADKIVEQFSKIYNQKNGIVEAEITTRKKIGEAEIKKMKQHILKKYQARKVVLKNTIDESLKGGFVLKVGDEVVDGSVKGKLNALKKFLVS